MDFSAIIRSPSVRAKLAMLLFLLTLLFGNTSLVAGFETDGGVPASCIFALVCLVWWVAYRISRSANGHGLTLGLVTLGLWIVNVAVVLVLDVHNCIVSYFFWASTATLMTLVTGSALSDARSILKTMSTPD